MSVDAEAAANPGERVVLRAELFHNDQHVIAHTTVLAEDWVSVRTDARLDLGAAVQLRLSFPRLLAPLDIDAEVVSRDSGSGHGYLPGFRLGFRHPPTGLERLRPLLRKLEAEATATGRARILLVEDSAVMRDCVEHGASRFSGPVEVETCSTTTGEEALERIGREPFDLALVDLYLPGTLSGADLVRAVRARGLDVPVIGYSVGGPTARDAFLTAGADLFLDKPVILRDLFRTLQRLMLAAGRAA